MLNCQLFVLFTLVMYVTAGHKELLGHVVTSIRKSTVNSPSLMRPDGAVDMQQYPSHTGRVHIDLDIEINIDIPNPNLPTLLQIITEQRSTQQKQRHREKRRLSGNSLCPVKLWCL